MKDPQDTSELVLNSKRLSALAASRTSYVAFDLKSYNCKLRLYAKE